MTGYINLPNIEIINMIAESYGHSAAQAAELIFSGILSKGYNLAEAKRFAYQIAVTDYQPEIALRFLVDYHNNSLMGSIETNARMHSSSCPFTLKLIGQMKYNMNYPAYVSYCDFRKIDSNIALLGNDLEMLRGIVRQSPILSELYHINVDNKVIGPDGLANSNMLLCSEAFKYETQAAYDGLRTREALAAKTVAAKY